MDQSQILHKEKLNHLVIQEKVQVKMTAKKVNLMSL